MKKARLGAERALLLRSRFAEKSDRNQKYNKRDRKRNKRIDY